jgi:hypothetical protein
MRLDLEQWLARLPTAEEQLADGISLDGWLIAGAVGEVRILVGRQCLVFSRTDVLEIEELTGEESSAGQASAIHVRLVIKGGARLLDACPSDLFDGCVRSRMPFALSTRPSVIKTGAMPRFRALERDFLQAVDPNPRR